MAEIKIVDENGVEKAQEPKSELKSENNISSPVLPELQEKAIFQVVGLDDSNEQSAYRHKAQTLLEYAKSQTEDHSPENLKWIIRSLELKLGTPPLAEKRVNYLARYAWLEIEESKLKKEKLAFERKI